MSDIKIIKRLDFTKENSPPYLTVRHLIKFMEDIDPDLEVEHLYDNGNEGCIEVVALLQQDGKTRFFLDGPNACLDENSERLYGNKRIGKR